MKQLEKERDERINREIEEQRIKDLERRNQMEMKQRMRQEEVYNRIQNRIEERQKSVGLMIDRTK